VLERVFLKLEELRLAGYTDQGRAERTHRDSSRPAETQVFPRARSLRVAEPAPRHARRDERKGTCPRELEAKEESRPEDEVEAFAGPDDPGDPHAVVLDVLEQLRGEAGNDRPRVVEDGEREADARGQAAGRPVRDVKAAVVEIWQVSIAAQRERSHRRTERDARHEDEGNESLDETQERPQSRASVVAHRVADGRICKRSSREVSAPLQSS